VRCRRRLSRGHATADRLGRRLWSIEYRGSDTLSQRFTLAVPTFHGNRMDVPRRLRPRRLSGPAQRQCENSVRDAGDSVAPASASHNQHRANSDTTRCHFLQRRSSAEPRFPVLWIEIRAATVKFNRTPIARRVSSLPSVVVRFERDTVQSGLNVIRFQTQQAWTSYFAETQTHEVCAHTLLSGPVACDRDLCRVQCSVVPLCAKSVGTFRCLF
jgi:hypothetical protein